MLSDSSSNRIHIKKKKSFTEVKNYIYVYKKNLQIPLRAFLCALHFSILKLALYNYKLIVL